MKNHIVRIQIFGLALLASAILLGAIVASTTQHAYAATLASTKVFTTDGSLSATATTYIFTLKPVSSASVKRIDITAPAGFGVAGSVMTGGSLILQGGTLAVSGQTMQFTVPSSSTITPSSLVTLQISGINNPSTVGPHTFSFATKNSAGSVVDSATAAITLEAPAGIPDGSIGVTKLGSDVVSYIEGLISALRTELLAAIGVEESARTAADTTQQSQLDSLQADVDALKNAVQIDGTTGDVTINSDSDIILKPAPAKGVKSMEKTTFEDNVDMMSDANVMGDSSVQGETALEGDVAAMSDAEIQGFLIMPPQVDMISGVSLTPSGSSIDVYITEQSTLAFIEPAEVGTELTIRFHLPLGQQLGIADCHPFSFGTGDCLGPGSANIDLDLVAKNALVFKGETEDSDEVETLKLRYTSDSIWEQVGKTQLSGYQIIIGPDQEPATDTEVPASTSHTFTVSCNAGDIAIGGSIESIHERAFTIDSTQTLDEDYIIQITEGPNDDEFRVTATCLHLS